MAKKRQKRSSDHSDVGMKPVTTCLCLLICMSDIVKISLMMTSVFQRQPDVAGLGLISAQEGKGEKGLLA